VTTSGFVSSENVLGPGTRTVDVDEALDFAERQVRELVTTKPGLMPTYTEGGRWVLDGDPWAPSWAGGFLTGMMWIFSERTQSAWWREQAEKYCLLLEPRKNDTGTHDIGFVLDPSWGRGYELDPSPRAREVLAQGGRTMAGRLQEAGGYLSTWVDPGSTFIDVMMNVGVIFRAAELSGDDALRRTALRHCFTSRRYLMRGDGSTVHEGWFDVVTGEFLRASTHQGWRSDSTWARGQAWAIYGFAVAYGYTHEPGLLDAARRAADYYIEHTPAHGVPPNDWVEPNPVLPWEASAASCAAAGMLRLAEVERELADDSAAAERHQAYGLSILTTLRSTDFLAVDAPGWEAVVRHATYHHDTQLAIDESVMWGDYYFVEALDLASRAGSASASQLQQPSRTSS
jgi:unsaturated chondroitin disaccharide hydrolase